jgi:hypothetical protein
MFRYALSAGNSELIKRLREEAKSVKDCFTNFSFQTIAFSAVVLGEWFRQLYLDIFITRTWYGPVACVDLIATSNTNGSNRHLWL